MLRVLVALMVGWGVSCGVVRGGGGDAAATEAMLTEAGAAYERGLALAAAGEDALSAEVFLEASERYRVLARDFGIESGGLWFNAGNAALMGGDVGRAVAAYLRARAIEPAAADVGQNLALARARVETRVEGAERGVGGGRFGGVLGPLVWVHDAARGWGKVWGFAGLLGLFWVLMGVRLWRARAVPRRVAFGVLGLAVAVGGSLAVDVFVEPGRVGVVVRERTVARSGPSEAYGEAFSSALTSGVELLVREERGGWVRGELADGRVAWVERGAIEVVELR